MSEKTSSFVIQYPIQGFGSSRDLERSGRIEELLNGALKKNKNGVCSGNDVGSNKLNIFVDEVKDFKEAFTTIIETLHHAKELDGAVVAFDPDPSNDNSDFEVVWPSNYSGEFSIL